MTESFLLEREVCTKYGVTRYTLLNWRRGYYFRKGEKILFFDDESKLDVEWNEKEKRLEYNPVKLAVWVNKLKTKHERMVAK